MAWGKLTWRPEATCFSFFPPQFRDGRETKRKMERKKKKKKKKNDASGAQ